MGEAMEQEQLGFEGMPRRLYSCTPTRLSSWLDCQRRYRMTYLDRPAPPKGPPWAHNSLGASVHNALAGWWRLARRQRTVQAAGDLLDRGWLSEGFADDAQSAQYRRHGRAMVEEYVAGLDPGRDPLGVERTVATKTDQIAFSGRIDRLDDRPPGLVAPAAAPAPAVGDGAADEPGDGGDDDATGDSATGDGATGDWQGGLVVVDYKTGRYPLTVADTRSSLALALYALAAERVMRRPCRRVELHHLPTSRVLAWVHTAQSLARQLDRAQDIAAECASADERYRDPAGHGRGDEVFPPRPGVQCGWCDFRAHCPEGRAAADARRPWDGLADLNAGAAGAGVTGAGVTGAGVTGAGATSAPV
jgi:RecB family exonuclease